MCTSIIFDTPVNGTSEKGVALFGSRSLVPTPYPGEKEKGLVTSGHYLGLAGSGRSLTRVYLNKDGIWLAIWLRHVNFSVGTQLDQVFQSHQTPPQGWGLGIRLLSSSYVYCGPLGLQKCGHMRLQESNYVYILCMCVRMYVVEVVISFCLTHTGITHSSWICWCDPFDQTPRLFKQVGLACETTPNQPHIMPSSDWEVHIRDPSPGAGSF